MSVFTDYLLWKFITSSNSEFCDDKKLQKFIYSEFCDDKKLCLAIAALLGLLIVLAVVGKKERHDD